MKRLLFILAALTHLLAICSGCNVDRTSTAASSVRPVIRRIVREEPPSDAEFAESDEQPAEIGRRRPIIRPRPGPRPGPFRETDPAARPPEVEVDADEVLKSLTQEELDALIEDLKRQRDSDRPAMTEREMALADTGLWFDEDAFHANMPHTMSEPEPARRVQAVFLKVQNCPPCAKQDREFGPLRENGWAQNSDEDAHIRDLLIDEDDTNGWAAQYAAEAFPVLILLVDGVESKRWERFVTRKEFVDEFSRAISGLPPLAKASKPPSFAAGEKKITKEQMDILLNVLGKSGPLVLPNSEILIEQQGVTFKIPAGVKATNTVSGSTRRLVFEPASKPSGKWSFLSASADALVLDVANYTLTAEMPGLIPDPVIKLLKE